MEPRYRRTQEGKLVKITKKNGVLDATHVEENPQEEQEGEERISSIASVLSAIIIIILFISACTTMMTNDEAEESEKSTSIVSQDKGVKVDKEYEEKNANDEYEENYGDVLKDDTADNQKEEEDKKDSLSTITEEVRYINQRYREIHNESWAIVKSDFKRNYIDYEHIDIMDYAYIEYDELAYYIETLEYLGEVEATNTESLNQYLKNIKEASVSKGFASMYYSYMISDAMSGYAEDPSDERDMNSYLSEADEFYEEAMSRLDEFAESNGIKF